MPSLPSKRRSALIGLGLDATDGHKRITRGEDFILAGGSEETHGRMREAVIKAAEHLNHRGKQIGTASWEEVQDAFHETQS